MAATSTNFSQILDARFRRIFDERFTNVPEIISKYFNVMQQQYQVDRFGELGTFGDMQPFEGAVHYDEIYQGYETTVETIEFTNGFQIDRKLRDDALFSKMEQKPKALADSLYRTRQQHAVRLFTNAFSVDNYFYNNGEGVAMCSNSHTTTSGASTATGFDNYVTTSLNAVSLAAARVQMVNFRGDRAQKINVSPSMLVVPEQGSMHETAWEILNSKGKVDTANNNESYLKGMFTLNSELWLEDANNWFLIDGKMMKENQIWLEKVRGEFENVEDFDSIIMKYRVYGRHGNCHVGWRHIVGAEVS